MTLEHWRSERRSNLVSVPGTPPAHLVSELLDVIGMISPYPTAEQVAAIKRLAQAIQEESKSKEERLNHVKTSKP